MRRLSACLSKGLKYSRLDGKQLLVPTARVRDDSSEDDPASVFYDGPFY